MSLVIVPASLGVVIAVSSADSVPHAQNAVSPVVPAATVPSAHQLLLAITLVTLATIAGGMFARWLRQPQVVGQMIVGLALGPSLLGRIAPGVEAWLFPRGTVQILALLGGIGAILFVFIVGQDFSLAELRRSGVSIVVLGQGMMAIPFLVGSVLALSLAGMAEAPNKNGLAFNLFIALAMNLTALPVLAHILRERGMDQTRVGAIGIASSAVGDATVWCFLAVALAMARSTSASGAFLASILVVLFTLAMWFGARPALALVDRKVRIGPARPALAICGMLLASLVTDSLGADAIFGAFVAGLILPRSESYRTINSKIEGLIEWLLLPMFFVSVGLQTQIAVLESTQDFLICGYVLIAAIVSKSLATLLVARGLGVGWHPSALLAAMMNCRGITELIVLNIGLAAGILNQKLFTIFTIMTVITTMMTGPALDLINRIAKRDPADEAIEEAVSPVPR